jgi:hypothetical protein
MEPANVRVRKIVNTMWLFPFPPPIRPKTTAKTIQPTISLKIAALTTTIPRSLRYRSISIRVLAITGSAEIDIAVAKKRANVNLLTLSSLPTCSERNHAVIKPNTKGLQWL